MNFNKGNWQFQKYLKDDLLDKGRTKLQNLLKFNQKIEFSTQKYNNLNGIQIHFEPKPDQTLVEFSCKN